ncbi:MAG: hypothetical protein QM780_08300 [Hyphomicrobium sp.]|uniref:hypothetical protein n=1 Tax=Hyphomicrobium sp. TaxID=82 RepID=UPI0039E6548E
MRFLVLVLLSFLAGCAYDPPVERIAAKKRPAERKVAMQTPIKLKEEPRPISRSRFSANTPLKMIRVKNCDCPEDFDAAVCGDRSAYASLSPNCPSNNASPDR